MRKTYTDKNDKIRLKNSLVHIEIFSIRWYTLMRQGGFDVNLWHSIFLIAVGFGGGFVQRVSGFGLGIFVMLFLPHFIESHTAAAAISCLFSCATTAYNSFRYYKDVRYKIVFPMIFASLVTIPIAVHFSSVVSGRIFHILLGSVLIILGLYFIFFNKHIKIKPNLINGIFSGTLGGVLNGLFSTGGPPAVLYLSSALKGNISYFATIQFYFCFTNLYSTFVRAADGIINTEILIYSIIGIAGCMAGDYIGKRIFGKLDSNKLKSIIYIGMMLSGIIMII